MKIAVIGDMHGETGSLVRIIKIAASLGIQNIVQCGDFGIWTHLLSGVRYLDDVNEALGNNDMRLVFVDGNHENHDHLAWHLQNGPKNDRGQVYLRSRIVWSPRGAVWKWDNKRMMSVGGAVSIDREHRVKAEQAANAPRTRWWPGEQLRDDELEEIIKRVDHHRELGRPIDYLFTHDCPSNAPFHKDLVEDPDSHAHRQRMDVLGKVVKPKLWFHGHMHERYVYDFPTYNPHTQVFGLECNGMRDKWGVLDTDDDSFVFYSDYLHEIHRKRELAEPDSFTPAGIKDLTEQYRRPIVQSLQAGVSVETIASGLHLPTWLVIRIGQESGALPKEVTA